MIEGCSRAWAPLMLMMALGSMASSRAIAGDPGDAAQLLAGTAEHVRVAAVDRLGPDSVAIIVVIEPGYHINANPASMDNLIPTKLDMAGPTPLRVTYPEPVFFKPKYSDDVLKVYEGRIKIVVEFTPGELARRDRLLGTLTAQACTDQICLPPADLDLPER